MNKFYFNRSILNGYKGCRIHLHGPARIEWERVIGGMFCKCLLLSVACRTDDGVASATPLVSDRYFRVGADITFRSVYYTVNAFVRFHIHALQLTRRFINK